MSNKDLTDDNIWLKEIPYDTRQLAIKELVGAYKSCFASSKKGLIKKFNIQFKSKKSKIQTFHVTKKALKPNLSLFVRRFGKKPLRTRKRMKRWIRKNIKEIYHDFIIMKQVNRWYICLPIKIKRKNIKNKLDVCALDPGVRTFQTLYSPNGNVSKFGDRTNLLLKRLNERIDKLKSIRSKKEIKKKKRYKMKKRCKLLRTKIVNIVSDLHWKTANHLCKTYKYILLPTFETKIMVRKKKRKITKRTTREMLGLSHYKFKEKLKQKAEEYGSKVIDVSEAYTSKTCSTCGKLKKIGGKEMFKCCYKMDRDINGARNILIRYLTLKRGHDAVLKG